MSLFAGSFTRVISFIALLVIIGLIGTLFFQVMSTFFVPLFLAALLVVMFRPLHVWFLSRLRNRARVAAGLTTACVVVIVLVPAAWIVTFAGIQAFHLVRHTDIGTLKQRLTRVRSGLGLNYPRATEYRKIEHDLNDLVERAKRDESPALRRVQSLGELVRMLLPEQPPTSETRDTPENPEPQQTPEPQGTPVTDAASPPDTAADPVAGAPPAAGSPAAPGSNPGRPDASDDAGSADPADGEGELAGSGDAASGDLPPALPTEVSLLVEMLRQLEAAGAADLSPVDYQSHLEVSRRLFDQYKIERLGGPVRAWLTEIANPSDDQIRGWGSQAAEQGRRALVSLWGTTAAFLAKTIVGAVIVVVAFYFFLVDGPAMIDTFMKLSPLDDRHERELLDEFDKVSRAVVLATILSAVAQAVLAGLGFWVAGVNSVFLLMLLTFLFAMIPFVGAVTVWAPTCLWLYLAEEQLWPAALLAVYGTSIVSTVDNIIKPWVLHGQSRLHPLFALLSVLGGVQALGPIGVLVGPMTVVFLQTLLGILRREVVSLESEGDERAAADPSSRANPDSAETDSPTPGSPAASAREAAAGEAPPQSRVADASPPDASPPDTAQPGAP